MRDYITCCTSRPDYASQRHNAQRRIVCRMTASLQKTPISGGGVNTVQTDLQPFAMRMHV
ncbi:Piso0_000393 [Millerozyma farinosa CBS 7064]|uniref:Piso0_000393 protein n=1 Tax=Pichia sorbitophila (strain ATCC MYA-4447 / BCRC 22081 / CBS 7064 / NBRC 10061 / NRRL Y-12695) TaxID=559304 RepID=G8YTV9_PICSO|nr:Piso0_000393 [Millerozyma farinosa CBS 7064]CCE73360.1 Piso0_000393 [Millerozyma farinosa CBS 7064]